ncbi:helix-turn-helix domain-containing protein [Symbioplanes lichenis]|uniref:helix-turn-helix domain-containing protein n=1 Tax=Symbioplanes lichenis TaxID=1629072 RepID=UPI002739218B|nr:helix-turn-helix transcriptional regulator [Actinoplanes lichenis]
MAIEAGPEPTLGEELARHRRRRGLTGRQLGEIVGMSQAKISRIETGAGTTEPGDVGTIARALDLGEDEGRRLVARAVMRMQNRMTDWRMTGSGLVRNQERMAELEAATTTYRVFQPVMIHGLLQTSEYARAVMGKFDLAAFGYGAVAEAVSARMKRQEVLTGRRKRFHFLLAEGALANLLCPAAVMLGQIERLRTAVRQDNVDIGVVPFDRQWAVPPMHGFDILDDQCVEIDLLNTGLTTQGSADIRAYRTTFDALWQQAAEDFDGLLDRYLERYLELARPGRRSAAAEQGGGGQAGEAG